MKILAFPQVIENPYQHLLYDSMNSEGDMVSYASMPMLIPQIFLRRIRGYQIFHLHWANAFSSRSKTLGYWHYLLCLKTIKLLGYKLVWTAHNALPHEQVFPNDTKARQALAKAADLVIAHSKSTLTELEKIEAKPRHAIVIPHGSYVGVYPNTIDRSSARKKLGLKKGSFIYLYLGQVRGYKGVEILSETYKKIKNDANYLIIAGKGSETGFIPDENLQIYFNAADVVVLPFKQITTSGSALLALSFGKAVIVPRLGDLAELPDAIAYKYAPQENDGLMNAMKRAAANPEELQQKSVSALAYAEQLSWPIIGKQTHNAMKALFKE